MNKTELVSKILEFFCLKYSSPSTPLEEEILKEAGNLFKEFSKKEIALIYEQWMLGKDHTDVYDYVFNKKKCYKCQERKDKTLFVTNRSSKDGVDYVCKPCKAQLQIELRKTPKHKEWIKSYQKTDSYIKTDRKKHLRQKYGITLEQFNAMLDEQEGKCKICGTIPEIKSNDNYKVKNHLYVDHDHETGKVRGLLCPKCNSMVGSSYGDIAILQKAIQYIIDSK